MGRGQPALAAAYAEYRSAMTSWRAASKAEAPAASETATERLLRARVRLYRELLAAGWGPPPEVGAQLDRDVALVEAPEDFDTLLTTVPGESV